MKKTIGEYTYYTSGSINTFDALTLSRKLAPTMPVIEGLIKPENAEKDKTALAVLALSYLSDSDCDFVVKKCLTMILRHDDQINRGVPIFANGVLMFADIKLPTMLDLTIEVIRENLGDFFLTALSTLKAQTPKEQSPSQE